MQVNPTYPKLVVEALEAQQGACGSLLRILSSDESYDQAEDKDKPAVES